MESEVNKKITETLEMFGVPINKVIGELNIVGHLKKIVTDDRFDQLKRFAEEIQKVEDEIGSVSSGEELLKAANAGGKAALQSLKAKTLRMINGIEK